MLRRIAVTNAATYGTPPEVMDDIGACNFVYGANGTGKTTISRLIADKLRWPECRLVWSTGRELEPLVYNVDFVDANFGASTELLGVFTLGKQSKETLEKIEKTRESLGTLLDRLARKRVALDGDPAAGLAGKRYELTQLWRTFEDACWDVKARHADEFDELFKGYKRSKEKFATRILELHESTAVEQGEPQTLEMLRETAATVLGEPPVPVALVDEPGLALLDGIAGADFLRKPIVGQDDALMSGLLDELGNIDWVQKGMAYHAGTDHQICPFCQQGTPPDIRDGLKAVFDDAYERDITALRGFAARFQDRSTALLAELDGLSEAASPLVNRAEWAASIMAVRQVAEANARAVVGKLAEPSRAVELQSLEVPGAELMRRVEAANAKAKDHNALAADLTAAKARLVDDFFRYMVEVELNSAVTLYTGERNKLRKAISAMEEGIASLAAQISVTRRELKALERTVKSAIPTIDAINALLQHYGFDSFKLREGATPGTYAIVRPDGTQVEDTLSEGERTFLTFLYFFHMLRGSLGADATPGERLVVIDDPISSLDSDVLYVVSSMVRELFRQVRKEEGHVRQVIVLTHNVYFHKEVSFNSRRPPGGRLSDERFWTVLKRDGNSKIVEHASNPVTTTYELLWREVRQPTGSLVSIQNVLRRILENYFRVVGGVDPEKAVLAKLDGGERLVAESLFRWVNDGSHFAGDDIQVSRDDQTVDKYLNVFRRIFEVLGHDAHYTMMTTGNLG